MPGMKGRCCTEAGEGGASLVDVDAFGGMADGVGEWEMTSGELTGERDDPDAFWRVF